jgi:hypothetical protein
MLRRWHTNVWSLGKGDDLKAWQIQRFYPKLKKQVVIQVKLNRLPFLRYGGANVQTYF